MRVYKNDSDNDSEIRMRMRMRMKTLEVMFIVIPRFIHAVIYLL